MRVASVILPMPLPEAFDYEVPDGMAVDAGDLVIAPLGKLRVQGVVAAIEDRPGHNRPLKCLTARCNEPPLPKGTLDFIQWAGRYAADVPGAPLAIALRGARAPKPRAEKVVVPTGEPPARMTPARERVLACAATFGFSPAALAAEAGVSSGVVKGLINDGALAVEVRETAPRFELPDPARAGATLNPSQAAARGALNAMLDEGGFQAALLDGVTGSGKTEVYLEAAAHALAADPKAQVLILLPEIALTQRVIGRITERFGAEPGEWHSAVSPPRRRRVWEAVGTGACRIVIGARSALFLPFPNLRLIVVDEEHDSSFKQEEGFIYQARDLAVARAKIEGAAVLLSSATPSLETVWNAEAGRYRWLKLTHRHGAARLPDVELIDLRETPPEHGRWLSPPLVRAMADTFERGEQSLLFLNRRGYAPVVLCKACGERLTSPDTHSWLVEHRYTGRLVCHLTGFSMPKPKRCPACQAEDSLVSVGPGVERVEEEARSLFPEARIAVFSSDTVMTGEDARTLVGAMEAGEIDILVATQAAAKGHNFPGLTLVGVVDADLSLRGGDLRAGERTYQLLAQVAGRAGRADRPGVAMLQTWMPDHAVMAALKSGDRDAFVAAEMAEREAAGLPPFGRLAAVILSSNNPVALEDYARALAACAPNTEGLEVYGPADAPLALVRGRRRKRFLVRANRDIDIQGFLAAWRARAKPPSSVRAVFDVDPYSFL